MLDKRNRKIELYIDYDVESVGMEYTVSCNDAVYGKMIVSGETISECMRGIATSMEVTAMYFLNTINE
jgi:hypothetical protein